MLRTQLTHVHTFMNRNSPVMCQVFKEEVFFFVLIMFVRMKKYGINVRNNKRSNE